MEFVVLLATPIAGALLLAVWGDRRWAAEINIGLSFATFLAAAALTIRVIGEGNLVAWREQFFLDPFNVFLVALTAFVGLTTAIFSRPYMRVEVEHGRLVAAGRQAGGEAGAGGGLADPALAGCHNDDSCHKKVL